MKKNIIVFLSIFLINPFYDINANDEYCQYTDEEVELIHYIESKEESFDISEGEVVAIYQITGALYNSDKQIEAENSNRGSIGNENMTMTIGVQRVQTNQTTYDAFRFTVIADWIVAPLLRLEDAIAISWSDDFTQYSHSCKAYYNSIGYISGKTSLIDSTPEEGVLFC